MAMSYLYVRIVEANGLAAADMSGYADPYCKLLLENVSEISAKGKKTKTKHIKKEIDPIWNEYFILSVCLSFCLALHSSYTLFSRLISFVT